jgi:MFS family permease
MIDREDADPAGVWGSKHRVLTAGLLLTVSMIAFEALAVATVLPATVQSIGGLEWYGWVFSSFMLTNLIGVSVGGQATDRHGAAPTYTAGAVLFTTGLLIAGLAPSMEVVIAGRAAQGLGAGAISAVSYVAVARGYATASQPRMLALLSSAWVIPGLLGPALAGLVAERLGWRSVFLALAPFVLLASTLVLPGLRRTTRPAAVGTSQVLPALRLALGAGMLLYGFDRAGTLPGAAVMAAGAWLGLRALVRLTPSGTLSAQPGLPAAIATIGLLSFSFFAAEAFLPLAITSIRGRSMVFAGMALTAGTLTWTAGAWLHARLAPRHGRRSMTLTGLTLLLAGIVVSAGPLTPAVPVAATIVGWGVAGLGMGLAYSTSTLVMLESAPAGQEGMASASLQLANGLGVALGTGMGGAVLALAGSTSAQPQPLGIAFVNLVALIAGVIALLSAGRLPARAPSQPAAAGSRSNQAKETVTLVCPKEPTRTPTVQ